MKKLTIFLSSLFLFFAGATSVYAIDFCPFGQFTRICQLNANDNTNFVGNIFTFLLVAAMLLAIGFLIIGGIKWILSGGDKGKVDGARSTVTGAIIGLVISLSAFLIISLVSYMFGIDDGSGTVFTLPRLYSSPDQRTPWQNTPQTPCSDDPQPGGVPCNSSLPSCETFCSNKVGNAKTICISTNRFKSCK